MITVRQFRGIESLPPVDGSTGGECASRLLLMFGSTQQLSEPAVQRALRAWSQVAIVAGASSDVTITNQGIDTCPVFTLLQFEQTRLRLASALVPDLTDSYTVGQQLGRALADTELAYVLLLADGIGVNSSALARGVQEAVGAHVPITGGLANDGGRFQQTLIVAGEQVLPKAAVAIGFYGKQFRVGHAAIGGWKPFGPLLQATRTKGNVVYEFDGQPALMLYDRYLGKDADGLPATGLLFPIALYDHQQQPEGLIRTLLGIDRERGALIFAGDVPEGGWVRLMHARFDELVDGAEQSAQYALQGLHEQQPPVALLISCIGRYFLMGDFIAEEVEAVRRQLGDSTQRMGFYSNGEICPFNPTARCELHNQTMTITLWVER